MSVAFLTTATPATASATRALAASIARHHGGAPMIVLAAGDVGDQPDATTVLRSAQVGAEIGYAVAETLEPADQVAVCLPFALRRASGEHGSCVYLEPGLLLTAPLEEVGKLLETHRFVLAARALTRERYATVPELELMTRSHDTVSRRMAAVRADADEVLSVWEQAVRELSVDPKQRRPTELNGVLPGRLLAVAEAGLATEGTLQSCVEYAAVVAGRVTGPACAVVEADILVDVVRDRAEAIDEVDVELALLNANVHDSRPLLGLVELLEQAWRPRPPAIPRDDRVTSFVRAVRHAADPFGRRWAAGDEAGFAAWLSQVDAHGTTRFARLWWAAHPLLQRVLPDPRLRPAALRLYNDRVGRRVTGIDLANPSWVPPPKVADTRLLHALRWRYNSVRAILPGRRGAAGAALPAVFRYLMMPPRDVRDGLLWRWSVLRRLVPGADARATARMGEDGTVPATSRRPDRVEVDREPLVPGGPPRELTLMGLFRSESGLGQASRASLQALQHLQRPFSHVDTSDLYPSRNSIDPKLAPGDFGARGEVNLLHANAGELVAWRDSVFRHRLAGRFNAAMCFWETANLPVYLRGVFDIVDELWLASEYLADVFGQYGRVPVKVIGLSADLPDAREVSRAALGLRDDEFTFLFVYDALSAHGRKNPEKALQAFVKAFAPDFTGVRFVMKVSNLNKFPSSEAALRRYVDAHPAITLVDDYLTRDGVLDLMAAADVYISLHAAEGYGLTILEAMALGTPVICTGYSGNMEFTTGDNSWLVDYKMVSTVKPTGPYPAGSVWASPDTDSAADLMRFARDQPAEVARKRAAAMRDAREAASLPAYAARLDAQLRRVL